MADMVAGVPTPNLKENVVISHGIKLFFKDESLAAPVWRDLGDISDVVVNPNAEFVEFFSNHDGKNSLAKRVLSARSLVIEANLNEVNQDNFRLATMGGAISTGAVDYKMAEVISENVAGDTFTLTHTPKTGTVAVYASATEEVAVANTGDTGPQTGSGGADYTYTGNTITAVAAGGIIASTKIRVEYDVEITGASTTELFDAEFITGPVQFHILNNQGGVAQIFEIDDAVIAPSGALNLPADNIQSFPITVTSLVKNGKVGRAYLKTDA